MATPMMPRPVLFVEDDENDVLLLKRAFAKLGSHIPLLVLSDGKSAWDYLIGSSPPDASGIPSLILLDLKLPGKSGLEILSALRSHPEFKKIPVLVMTSSALKADVDRAYGAGADFYLVKPDDAARRQEMAEAIHAYWLAVHSDPDHMGSDPTMSRLRAMAEPPPPAC